MKASEAFRDTFGSEVQELNPGVIVAGVRRQLQRYEDDIASALDDLTKHQLPGHGMLETALGQIKAILRGSEDAAIGTFNASFRSIKDAIKRAAELRQAHIGNQPAGARTRVLCPGGAAQQLPHARGESAPVVGDQKQCVAVIGVGGVKRRHQIAGIRRHQCQPLFEAPLVEECGLLNQESLDLADRERRRGILRHRAWPYSAASRCSGRSEQSVGPRIPWIRACQRRQKARICNSSWLDGCSRPMPREMSDQDSSRHAAKPR